MVTTRRECGEPARYVPGPTVSAVDDVVERAARHPDHAAVARKAGRAWHTITSRELADEVMALAAGLVASGVRPGDRVALMSATRYEWMLCDFAIWAAGAVTVPIYETSSPEQVRWILDDSGAVAALVEDDRRRAVVARAGAPGVRRVWRMTGGDLDELRSAGRAAPAGRLARRRDGVTAASPATIVYTSGTTGRPKGCLISHGELVAEVRNVALADGVGDRVLTPASSILLFLPLAHILARVVQLAAVHNGALLAHTDLGAVTADLAAFRPTIVLAVPRVFEKLHATARRRAVSSGRERLFRRAEATAIAYSRSLEDGGPSLLLRLRHRILDRLVYARLRAAMGGRVAYAVSGGAPLGARLGHFFRGAGVTVLEGWGLTETCAGVTLNLPSAQRIGTVGRPLPGCAVRIADDGEVLVRGANVFDGYWRDDTATRAAFRDGWLRTGDIGRLDADGYLSITGRKKDLIITAAGKNVAPEPAEDRIRAHWLVDQCILVGDRRPYIGALITLDPEMFAQWKREHGRPAAATVAELRDDPELRASVQEAVDDANAAVSAAESVRRFRLLGTEFTVGDELTPTQKARRDHVLAKFADEVTALYASR